jgi:hypothetical protein
MYMLKTSEKNFLYMFSINVFVLLSCTLREKGDVKY